MDNLHKLQQHLRLLRTMLGWSAQKLGEEVGVTRQTINKIENTKSPISQTLYLALLTVFKRESSAFNFETRMIQCILDILIFNPDYYTSSETEQALRSAQLLVSPTSSDKDTKQTISDEWVRTNKRIYQKFFDRLLNENKSAAIELNQINPTDQNDSVFELKKEGVKPMRVKTRKRWIELFEEYDREIKGALFKLYKDHILDSLRHELWMYVDDDGEVSLRTNMGYASNIISNEQRCFIYACGGENLTAWDILPRLEYLLNAEDLHSYCDAIRKNPGDRVRVSELQKYIETEHPGLIEEWLEEYFEDPSGYLEDCAQRVYEDILNRLDG